MTIAEILSNEELRRHEFPVVKDKIFLGHAGDCPLPRRVAEAITKYAHQCTGGDQERFVYPQILTESRNLAARILNSKPEEVSLVGPTSLALSFIANGLNFRKHDNILIYFDRQTQGAVLTQLCAHLRPGGYLFLGHSETLSGHDLPVEALGNNLFQRI